MSPSLTRVTRAALHATLLGAERARSSKTRGRFRLSGITSAVEILRDRWGVPHIYAASSHDLLFAQGFVHAQDRLWQMDFQRRVVRGRLSEIFGSMALETDRAMRILGMYRVAEAEAAALGPEARAEMEAYAAGVNAAIVAQPLPIEFSLLRYRPELWMPADSLCWSKMMAWGLSINWETELLRAQIIARLGPELASELEQGGRGPIITSAAAFFRPPPAEASRSPIADGVGAQIPVREPDLPSAPASRGSNSWVIAGSRTASGKPLLANDMHLPISSPAIWYENHLALTHGERLDVTGVSFPGIPYVVSGHNGRVAWGFTNGFADVQDLYTERLRRDRGRVQVEWRGEWRDADTRQEIIVVKGGSPVTQEVIVTDHGPVINELARGLASSPGADGLPAEPLALRWTALDAAPEMIDALRAMNRADDCDAFRDAMRGWVAPVQNVVYADAQGNIGYTFAGRVPIRAQGEGKTPVPGWTGEWEWTGFIPFEELPHQSNPERGFIATANNRIVDDFYPYFISDEYGFGDRAERIVELIERTPKLSAPVIRQMHLDQRSPSMVRLAKQLGQLQVSDRELQGLVALVSQWDRELRADSPAAAVCEIFGRLMQRVILEARLGREVDDGQGRPSLLDRAMGRGPTPGIQESSFFYHRLWEWLYDILERPDSHWFDLGQREKRDDVMRIALRRTYNYLAERFGAPQPDYSNWAWGNLHMVTFGHVAGRVPALAAHFNRGPYPLGGDGNTIFATGGGLTREASTAVVGPPFRFIADLSDLSRCYGLLAPGNSGRPDSPHYDDQIKAWFKGKYHPMLYRREDVDRSGRRRLRIEPG
jgi:penicillin G amidase